MGDPAIVRTSTTSSPTDGESIVKYPEAMLLSLFVLPVYSFVAFGFIRAIVLCCLVVSSPWWLPFPRRFVTAASFLGLAGVQLLNLNHSTCLGGVLGRCN